MKCALNFNENLIINLLKVQAEEDEQAKKEAENVEW